MRPCFLLVLAFASSAFAQTNYCVNQSTGNDSNTGIAPSCWATVSKAATQQSASAIAPGSFVRVDGGTGTTFVTYYDQIVISNPTTVTSSTVNTVPLPASGSAGLPITWYANGNVAIDAADIVTGQTWTLNTGICSTCYQSTFTVHPEKFFVDPSDTIPMITASISGTTLTVTATSGGKLTVGSLLTTFGASTTVAPTTTITALGTGTGGTGTYTVSISQTVPSSTMMATQAQLTPMANFTGFYSTSASYNEYDLTSHSFVGSLAVSGGSGMTTGTYPITFSGGTPASTATGTVTVTSATTATVSLTNGGSFYNATPTATAATGGTPPAITVTMAQNGYMLSPNNFAIVNSGSTTGYPWIGANTSDDTNLDSFKYSLTNSGMQNVAANPGSWYITPSGSNWVVTMNLADGSSPASHVLKATHRDTNISLLSVDYVTFTGFTLAHAFKQAVYNVANLDSSLGGNYWTGEYNTFTNMTAFNCGNIGNVSDVINPSRPTRPNHMRGCIVSRTGGETNAHFLRLATNQPFISNSLIGPVDDLYGAGNVLISGINMQGIDGGSTANNDVIRNNKINTSNTTGVMYKASDLTSSTTGNLGGRISYNEVTNSIGGFQTGNIGGRYDHNFLHDLYGAIIQGGGPGAMSTSANPLIVDHNVLANGGQGPQNNSFNGFDCNGATQGSYGLYELNNTIFNTPQAGLDFESGCGYSTVRGNITDMKALIARTGVNVWSPPGNGAGGTNGSSQVGISTSDPQVGVAWLDNHFFAGCTGTPTPGCAGNKFSGRASCATWPSYWPQTGVTLCEDKDPLFTNVAGGNNTANDLRLQSTSPDIGQVASYTINGVSTTPDMGAVPYGTAFPFVAPPINGYGVAF